MPDLLGVTNPVPGYDAAANNRSLPVSPSDPRIQNIPDPSRVGRPDARTDRQDTKSEAQSAAPRFDSNFQTFLQRLRETPDTSALFRLLSGRLGTVVTSGLGEGLAAELGRFMEMLPMDQGQLLGFLTGQMREGARFGGPFFALLLRAYQNPESEGMRADILQFLKRYGDYSSTGHITGNLIRNLSQMARAMPASWGAQLNALAAALQNGADAGDRAGSLKLLQGQVLPYMSRYVEQTHDMGRARELLTLLTLDIARYENGSEGGLLQTFHQLKNYASLREKLGGLDDGALLRLLRDTPFVRAGRHDAFAAHLADAAARALRGEGGPEAQEAFRELVSAFLVNESVYMNVNHFILPLNWNGKLMFSELWVDPDAEGSGDGAPADGERTLRFLFKVDIQSLGFLDMVLTCRGRAVDLQVRCPDRLVPCSAAISRALTRILDDNGLSGGPVRVERLDRPLAISEVFPKLFEGKDSVDVKV